MESYAPAPTTDEWPNCYIPRPGMTPRRSPITAGRPLRVLIAPIVVQGSPQNALRQAFKNVGPFMEVVHDGNPNREIVEAARSFKPDLIWAQIQCDGWQALNRALLDVVGPDCTMVQWNGDIRTDANQPLLPWFSSLTAFDLHLFDNCTYPKKLAQMGIRAGHQPIGHEPDLVWEPDAQETGKAIFVGTNYKILDKGARERLFGSIQRELPGVLQLYGTGWPSGRQISFAENGRLARRAAVTISTSLFSNLERCTSNRLPNAFYAGAVTAVEKFPDMEGLGLKPGENCLTWSTASELIGLLRDWTRDERAGDRQIIRERAHNLAVERFSWDRSVEEMLAIVRDYRARRKQS